MVTIRLDRLAYHFVDKQRDVLSLTAKEYDISAIDTTISKFFAELIEKLWKAEESGTTISGHFSGAPNPSRAKPLVEEILKSPATFFENSICLAELLFEVSPMNASPGVLVVLLCTETENKTPFIAIYKVKYENAKLITLLAEDKHPQLEVEEVRNALSQALQKGALVPHPYPDQFDLKIVEGQARKPPVYFKETFLGCLAKKAVEHQVKQLIPELRRYADERGLPRDTAKLSNVLRALSKVKGNVKTADLIRAVERNNLFGKYFNPDDFREFLSNSDHIAQLNIPASRILVKSSGPRKMILTFSSPELQGMKISAPIEVIERIRRSADGDTVVFSIETTEASLNVSYE